MADASGSGRLQTVTLKAEPAPEKAKQPGGSKGSWGKTAPKPKATGAPAADGVRVMLSNGSSGFEIPVKTNMFESEKI